MSVLELASDIVLNIAITPVSIAVHFAYKGKLLGVNSFTHPSGTRRVFRYYTLDMFKLNTILPFAFFAIANALPPAGTYNIISRILSPSGQQLAVTFNGEGAAVTLQPLASTDIAQIVSGQLFLHVQIAVF